MNVKRTDTTIGKEYSDALWKVLAVVVGVLGLTWLFINSSVLGLFYLALIVGLPALALYWIIRLAVAHGTKR